MENAGSTHDVAERYIREFGMEGKRTEFYKMLDYVAHTISMMEVKRGVKTPDPSYRRELRNLGLIGPDGYASEKGEGLLREVNSKLYNAVKGL